MAKRIPFIIRFQALSWVLLTDTLWFVPTSSKSTDLCRRCTFQIRLFQLKMGTSFEIGFPLLKNSWKSNSAKIPTSLLSCFLGWLDQKRLSLMFWSEHPPPLVQVQINCQHNSYLLTFLGKRVKNSKRSRTRLNNFFLQ